MNLNNIRNKRAIIITLFTLIIAVSFWYSSRYPALGSKSHISQTQNINETSVMEGTFGHRVKHKIDKDDNLSLKIFKTTLNWISANLKGMSFGLIIAASFLTLLKYFKRRHVKNKFLNSAIGMLLGAPLGVCSNCVAPVARGFFQGGGKMESALALMFSSPTFYIVVLTMLFTVFPLKLALIKVILTLLLVLVIVPLLAMQNIKTRTIGGEACEIDFDKNKIQKESWLQAFKGSILSYFSNFIYIFVRVVPLMVLAGTLGSIASHLFNMEFLSGGYVSFTLLLTVALIATFLPMPIAVDILLAQALMFSGLPMPAVMTILFCLGSYSIYSFLIIYRTFSLKLALQLFLIIAILGVFAGYLFMIF